MKTPKIELINNLRGELISPTEAVKEFERLPQAAQKGGRVYQQKSLEERRKQYLDARTTRTAIKQSRIPFINRNFLPDFWLSQGLIVVGAESGKAKSTTCSNVLYGFLSSTPNKTAIIISNEEATDAVYERTACIALKINYTDFFRGNLNSNQEHKIRDYVIEEIIPRVEVIEDGSYDMSYLEDVQSVLDTAAIQRVGIVLIDYLQIITQSRNNSQWEPYQISKALGLYLKNYGKSNGIPVVCFAQLHSTSRGPTMAERIQNDKTFYNHGFACIEIVPDFETLTTTFKIHKDRFFGHTGKEIVANFNGGSYIFAGDGDL